MSAIQIQHQDDFALIRDARVEVKKITNFKGQNEAEITINDAWQHRFPVTSRVSRHLDVMEASDLQERMNGGSYFIVADQLVDWRDGHYHGFAHTDESIGKFMEVLGYQTQREQPWHRGGQGGRANKRDGESDIVLRKIWDQSEIIVPGYAQGANFTSQLSFTWNPFVKTINSAFDLVRLICTNGMVGLTSFLNTKVPLVNRWEEHLNIAATQIQNKVNSVVTSRIGAMVNERSSVADCLLLEQHIYDRLHAGGAKEAGEREQLLSLLAAVSPSENLKDIYQFGVFQQKQVAAHLPAHLSNFDTFNIATELRTHTSASKKSSDVGLDKFANSVLFSNDDGRIRAKSASTSDAAFSNAERAFWGQMH